MSTADVQERGRVTTLRQLKETGIYGPCPHAGPPLAPGWDTVGGVTCPSRRSPWQQPISQTFPERKEQMPQACRAHFLPAKACLSNTRAEYLTHHMLRRPSSPSASFRYVSLLPEATEAEALPGRFCLSKSLRCLGEISACTGDASGSLCFCARKPAQTPSAFAGTGPLQEGPVRIGPVATVVCPTGQKRSALLASCSGLSPSTHQTRPPAPARTHRHGHIAKVLLGHAVPTVSPVLTPLPFH